MIRPADKTAPSATFTVPGRWLPTVAAALLFGLVQPLCARDHVELVFAGDIMLADGPGKAMARGVDPFAEFSSVFAHADASIGNLECVVADVGVAERKPWTFRASPAVMPVLAKHFKALGLANNHTGDFGHDAFLQQLGFLEKHKIPYFGGGRDCAHARQPLILELRGTRIAVLGYNDFKPRRFEAGPSWPGVAWAVDEQITADIQAARTIHRADLVIPFMHWGWESEPANDREKQLARLMIDAGADVVVGGHPHVTQETEYYKGHLIVYSLGNFVFDGFKEGPERTGWLLRLRLSKTGLLSWDTVVAKMDDEGIPHLQKGVASPAGTTASEPIRMTPAAILESHPSK